MVAIAGGTASLLGGGKFSNGAMSAAFVFMFNEMAGYRLKQTRGRYNISDRAGDRGLIQSGKSRALLVITKQDMTESFDNMALASGTAALYAGPTPAGSVLGAYSLFCTGASAYLNGTPDLIDARNIAMDTAIDVIMPPTIPGAFVGEVIKTQIR